MEWNLKHNISKLVDATKVRLKRKFIALNVYVKQNKTKQISVNDLSFYFKKPKMEEQRKPKSSK